MLIPKKFRLDLLFPIVFRSPKRDSEKCTFLQVNGRKAAEGTTRAPCHLNSWLRPKRVNRSSDSARPSTAPCSSGRCLLGTRLQLFRSIPLRLSSCTRIAVGSFSVLNIHKFDSTSIYQGIALHVHFDEPNCARENIKNWPQRKEATNTNSNEHI